ncbi:hypothetical protein ACFLWA_06180 [Chloroflexota bacterium]
MSELRRQHKLAGQSVALILMMIIPVVMYYAAEAGGQILLSVLVAVMATSMVFAAWIG